MRERYVDRRSALLLAVIVTTAACSAGGQRERTAPQQADHGRVASGGPSVPITIGHVVQKPVPLELHVIGTVEPSSTVSIRAQVTGELTSVTFREGDNVREGQLLFSLDRRPLDAALEQAEANLQRDSAQAANAAAQANRMAELAQRGIATREQVETSAASATALGATVDADRAAVENARVQVQYASIRAPIAGRTGALQVHPGNLVRANDTTPLVVINQVTPVNVSFAVPEAQLPLLKEHLAKGSVRVEAAPPADEEGGAAEGHITFVDNTVDPTTGTIRLKGAFPNRDRRLWPGQFVNVIITLATDPMAIVVPSTAIQIGQQGPYVFVVTPDNTAELRTVTISRVVGDDTIVSAGLKANDVVVTDGQLRLVPGTPVSVKAAPAAGAGA